MSDPDFLQVGFEEQTAHLIEEMGEAIQAAGKTLRWGAKSVNPLLPEHEQETNWNWIKREMADVLEAWDRLQVTAKEWNYD